MIKIKDFTKKYDGVNAVDGLNLEIEEGDIYGFIGPNGAGKTTTLRFLATLLDPTRGDAWICGHSVRAHPDKVKRCMAFMPDHFGVYDGMRVWEYLDFFAVAYGIPSQKRLGIIDDILVLLDLQTKSEDLVNGLSRGMRQRLGVAKTLVHDPPVLLLDEPASGMDPRARMEITELLKELKNMGKTILISSHILSELASCCNKIGIIEKGLLRATGPVADVVSRVRVHLVINVKVLSDVEAARKVLAANPKVSNLTVHEQDFRFSFPGSEEDAADLHASLMKEGVRVLWFHEEKVSLEEVFLRVTEGVVA